MNPPKALLVLVLAGSLATSGPAAAILEEGMGEEGLRFAPIDRLAGACWMGTFANGARDVHCYEWSLQDGFIHDHHQVRGGESGGVYEGNTYFGWDVSKGRLAYWYFNSLGGVSEGSVEQSDGDWFFREAYEGATHEEGTVAGKNAGELQIRTRLSFDGDDAYAVLTEFRREGVWQVEADLTYSRLGQAPAVQGGKYSEDYGLVFNDNRGGDYDLYRLDLATGEAAAIAPNPGTDWVYVGGNPLLMVSGRPAGSEPGYRLYRMDPGGGEPQRITDFPVADSWVARLPGDRGYVVCAEIRGDRELLKIDPDGEILGQLTDNEADDCNPDVTPDGKTLIFWSDRGGSGELWSRPLSGGEAVQLTSDSGNDRIPKHRYGGEGPPRVSPDGQRIAWMSIRGGNDWDVYTMNLDGSDIQRLTDSLSDDGYPSWSPDGRWIAFDSDRYGSFDLFVVRAEGGRPDRLTDGEDYEQAPVWVGEEGSRGED